MFRFDNPDALLTLLLVGSAYATPARRRVARQAPGPLAGARRRPGRAGVPDQDAAGVPGASRRSAWSTCSSRTPRCSSGRPPAGRARRDGRRGRLVGRDRLAVAGGSRPYIGGSQDNSILELTLGYNGFGRLTGDEAGSVGGGGNAAGGMWGETGLGRLLERRDRRPDRLAAADRAAAARRRALVHPPAPRGPTRSGPAWCSGAAGWSSPPRRSASWPGSSTPTTRWPWPPRSAPWSAPAPGCSGSTAPRCSPSGVASAAVSLTTVLSFFLLGRTSDFVPWLRWVVLVAGLVVALAVAGLGRLPAPDRGAVSPRRRSWSRWPAPRRTPSRPRPPRTPARSRAPARRPRGGFGGGPAGGPGGRDAGRTRRRRRRPAQRQRVHRHDHRAAAGGRRRTTPGSRPRSAPTPRPATSWPARSR